MIRDALHSLRAAVYEWGSDDAERAASYPCDRLVTSPDAVVFRALTIGASPGTVFRWLCQLRVAPYSYDWIDNAGRRSPQQLTPGVEQLEVGQPVMSMFTLVDFDTDRHLTLHADHPIFGEIAITYQLTPRAARTRLVVKLRVRYPRQPHGRVLRLTLPAGDLIMMRKQLLTIARLAAGDETRSARERDAGTPPAGSAEP